MWTISITPHGRGHSGHPVETNAYDDYDAALTVFERTMLAYCADEDRCEVLAHDPDEWRGHTMLGDLMRRYSPGDRDQGVTVTVPAPDGDTSVSFDLTYHERSVDPYG